MQRVASIADLDAANMMIEERDDHEPHVVIARDLLDEALDAAIPVLRRFAEG